MTLKKRDLAKHHFLFSNRLFQFLTNQRPDIETRNQFVIFLSIITFICPSIIGELYLFFIIELSLKSTVKIIQQLVAVFIIISTYSVCFFRFETVKLLLSRLQLDYEKFSNLNELYILGEYTVQTKFYVYTIMVFFYVYCFSLIFPSIFNVFLVFIGKLEDNQLTIPLIKEKSFQSGVIFYSMLSYQIFFIIIVTVIGSFSFSAFFILIQHACCQYTIIRLKIRQPFEKTQNYNKKCLHFCTQNDEYNWIIDIINRHQKSIEFVDMLRYVSNEAYFIGLSLAMILTVFNFVCILQYSELSESAIDTIEFSMYVFGSFFTIYINFYLGQKLLNHSKAVFVELCQIPFYTLSINTQKLILFMITRSGKPCFLSIGNMFVSSHEVFSGLLRKAFSFAMVYYSAQ